jgi:LysM repeat protein
MIYRCVCTLLVTGWCLSQASSAQAKNSHVVSPGDTLWDISRSYGCEVKALRQVNELGSARLNIGQKLQIPSCKNTAVAVASEPATIPKPTSPNKRAVTHTIVTGDTLGRIATRYHSSVEDILQRNRLKNTTIIAGERLLVMPDFSESTGVKLPPTMPSTVLGQSIGKPNRGRLKKAAQLKRGQGYFIRRPHRSYGATHTVGHLKDTLAKVHQSFPKMHELAIGDLSAKHGGKITMHASHQSGRDVDIGFYFKSKPKGYPQSFVVANHRNIHFGANWALLEGFAELAKDPGGVDRIFMSYSSQKIFYKRARKEGVSKAKLKRMFQYPAGKSANSGVIRHEPGHDEHIHVRFKCPPNDKSCY